MVGLAHEVGVVLDGDDRVPLGGEPQEAVYVGDSPFDIGAAKAAGVYSIAVGWGGIHPDERLLAEEPDAFVRTPQELLDAL